MPVTDTLNAFVPHGLVERSGKPGGPLGGLTFGLKDLFDLAGVPTGAGSPDWLNSQPVPTVDSDVARRLLDAGATLVGKTHTDEMAWSLNGENAHYGTPINAAAPGRIPGGSSSGSAAAVGGGLVDFAIGSDTGGSVRLPASYCGVYGLRPTHGRVDISGAVALAESYDVVGWFTREPDVFAKVGSVLLGERKATSAPTRLLIAEDLFGKIDRDVMEAHAPAIEILKSMFKTVETVSVAGDALPKWRDAFPVLQSADAWAYHKNWVESHHPNFGPGVKERFANASKLTQGDIDQAQAVRDAARKRMDELLDKDTILVLPTTPGIALMRNTPIDEVNAFRAIALQLLCIAGHAGLPQLSMPVSMLHGCPLGLSIMAARGSDEMLIDIIQHPALKRRTA